MTLIEFGSLLPEIFISIVAMVLLIAGVFTKEGSAAKIALLSLVSLCFAGYLVWQNMGGEAARFGFMYMSDSVSSLGKILILIGAVISLIYSLDWLKQKHSEKFEYSVLILFSTVGLMLMVSAADFLGLYMGLELSSLCLYILASIDKDNVVSSEAGLKYFVLGSLASGIMLFGISLIYGFAGTTEFAKLSETFISSSIASSPDYFPYGIIIGMVMVIAAFCFKLSAAPFHMWTPDVYQGSPTPVTAFFATAPKVAMVFLLIKVLMQPFFELSEHWQQIIIFVSAFSMLVGALGGLMQTNIKRMLAYSSIGHVGYALMGLAALSDSAVESVIIYITIYLFMSAGIFGCVLLMQRKGKFVEDIKELRGSSANHPYLSASIAVLMFSMAGIPPLAGFFGKMYVFIAVIDAELFYLAVFGLLMSVLSAFYYLRVVKVMYFDEVGEKFDAQPCRLMRLAIAICICVSVGFILKPILFTAPAEVAIQALL